MSDVSNTDDIIDSRDVIARIEELESEIESEKEAIQEKIDDLVSELDDLDDLDSNFEDEKSRIEDEIEELKADLDQVGVDEAEELEALKELASQGEMYASDWKYGETLISEGYFLEYAQQLADDLGVIDRNAVWPLNHIDWEAAADDLKQDYTEIDFDGNTYYIRNS